MSVRRFFNFPVFAIIVLGISVAVLFPGNVQAEEKEIVVQIAIPGVTFTCQTFTRGDGTSQLCVRSLGEYIDGFYRFFATAVSIIAATMVLWGGFKWLTAAGSSSQVQEAKSIIYSSLIAILLTFGSYILLVTINPQLINLELPGITRVPNLLCSQNPPALISPTSTDGCNPSNASSTGSCCGKTFNVVIGEGKTETCLWDMCEGANQVCREQNKTWGCQEVIQYCQFEKPGNVETSDWCEKVDKELQQTKTRFGKAKFEQTGCGFKNVTASGDLCLWNYLFRSVEAGGSPKFPSGYQPKFVDCFTAAAEKVCWEKDKDGRPKAKDCAGGNKNIRQFCKNRDDFPRSVAGAAGGCITKRIGSDNKDDYLCWALEPLPLKLPY